MSQFSVPYFQCSKSIYDHSLIVNLNKKKAKQKGLAAVDSVGAGFCGSQPISAFVFSPPFHFQISALNFHNQCTFLDAQASLAPTHVSPSVRDTFEFPFYQCLWLLYVKS